MMEVRYWKFLEEGEHFPFTNDSFLKNSLVASEYLLEIAEELITLLMFFSSTRIGPVFFSF